MGRYKPTFRADMKDLVDRVTIEADPMWYAYRTPNWLSGTLLGEDLLHALRENA